MRYYKSLHKWSVNNRSNFWSEVWDFYKLIGEKGDGPILFPKNLMPGTKFFPKGKISYAENILKSWRKPRLI